MPKLPYRYQEILTALRDNPQGLTTGQIYDICKRQGGSELPSATIASQCIYALRQTNCIQTRDSITHGGAIHTITTKGREKLKKEGVDVAEAGSYCFEPVAKAPSKVDEKMEAPAPVVQKPLEDAPVLDSPEKKVDEHSPLVDFYLAEIQQTSTSEEIDVLAAFDDAAKVIRECLLTALENAEAPIKIKDKPRKLSALERLEQIVSDDIAALLAAIRTDLEQLEDEAISIKTKPAPSKI